jgi:hypothetical protein
VSRQTYLFGQSTNFKGRTIRLRVCLGHINQHVDVHRPVPTWSSVRLNDRLTIEFVYCLKYISYLVALGLFYSVTCIGASVYKSIANASNEYFSDLSKVNPEPISDHYVYFTMNRRINLVLLMGSYDSCCS